MRLIRAITLALLFTFASPLGQAETYDLFDSDQLAEKGFAHLPHLKENTNSVVSIINPRRISTSSGIVVGTTNDGKLIILTANHNLDYIPSPNGLGAETASLNNISVERKVFASIKFPGEGTANRYTALPAFVPSPMSEIRQNVKPSQDFGFLVVTGQTHQPNEKEKLVGKLLDIPLPKHSFSKIKIASAVGGSAPIVIGYSSQHGKLTGSGEILEESIAKKTLSGSSFPYDPQSEFVIHLKVYPGMSGGGVFDSEGRLIGITSRSLMVNIGGETREFARVVRATHAAEQLSQKLESMADPIAIGLLKQAPMQTTKQVVPSCPDLFQKFGR